MAGCCQVQAETFLATEMQELTGSVPSNRAECCSDPNRKIFAIGDIHGCYDKLVALMKILPYDREKDLLVFMGDYINRGPDSRKVIDYLLELQITCKNTVFLKGNHEEALLHYGETGDLASLAVLRSMGIEKTVESYDSSIGMLKELAMFPKEHRLFLKNLKYVWLDGRTVFTHADITREIMNVLIKQKGHLILHPTTEGALLSSRRLGNEETGLVGYRVVFAHLPFATPLFTPDRICIDTGAVYGNFLTALQLPDAIFYHS